MTSEAETDAAGLRSRIGAWAAPIAFLVLWIAPLPLPDRAGRLAPIVAAVLIAWVTEVLPIPATALLIAPAMVLMGVTDAKTAAYPYASPLLFVFVGGFFIAHAMQMHGLDRRIAHGVLSLGPVGKSGARARAALMATAVVLSMWISNTAATAILLPIAMGTLGDKAKAGDRRTVGLLLAVSYAASVGGLGTPVGSPPNLITMGLLQKAGIEWHFVDWVTLGLPAALILAVVVFIYFLWMAPPGENAQGGLSAERRAWSRGEKVTAAAFGLAVVGWMSPGAAIALKLPVADWLRSHLPAGGVAILAASVLFAFRDGRSGRRVLPWSEATRIDWGLIFFFGGGISMGNQMFDTGLARALGRGFIDLTGVHDVWVLTAAVSLLTIFFTEGCSNTATANMLVPLVIGVAQELGVSPIPPALGVGLAASCAFMLPVATGPNAIAYGTGKIPITAMISHGFRLNLLSWVVLMAYLRLMGSILGW